jgi:beta-xylosidase
LPLAVRPPLRLLLLSLVVALAGLAAMDAGNAGSTVSNAVPLVWRNPVIAADFPDPSVVRDGDGYWATSTSSAAAPGFPLMRSTDLVHWTPAGTIFSTLPPWAADSFWAPEIYIDPGGVRVYYAARQRGGRMCVAVAVAAQVQGPYTDRGKLVCQPPGSIDPTRARDRYGRLFLIWKEDGNAVGHGSAIWRQRLSADGLQLVGRPRVMLRSASPWEGQVVEAPSVVVHGGWTYLFYSGNTYGSTSCGYALGVARARTLAGPFRRGPRNPILRSGGGWRCPGHASFMTDNAGRALVMYHAYPLAGPGERNALLDGVRWGADGWPSVTGDVPSAAADLR